MKIKVAACSMIYLFLVLLFGCSEDSETPNPFDLDPNHPPVIEEQADTFATVDETLILQALASDADGDTLQFSAVVHATWSEILDGYVPNIDMDEETGICQFIPSEDDVPERSITFIVDDQHGGLDSTVFVVTVNE
jgi:hypothetical protein